MENPQDWPDSREFWRNRQTMVTGGNGFLGKHLVRKLHERGADVFIADIDRYDLRHLDDIRRALSDAKPQMVIHLAARHRPVYPRIYARALRAKGLKSERKNEVAWRRGRRSSSLAAAPALIRR